MPAGEPGLKRSGALAGRAGAAGLTGAASRPLAFWLIAYCFVVNMVGTTLPTPLYPVYQARFGFSSLVVTVVFAVYALGVIAALLVAGGASDQVGRRSTLGVGLALSAAAAAAFVTAHGLTLLFVGRVLSGLSAGTFTGTATAYLGELGGEGARRASRATLVATFANMGGLGLGPLLAGVLSQLAPFPLRLSFVVDLGLLGLGFVALALSPESVDRRRRASMRLRAPAVPAQARAVFAQAATAGFAGFAVLGLFTAVAPVFMGTLLHIGDRVVTGAVVAAVFAASTAGQLSGSRMRRAGALRVGCVGLLAGMGLVAAAIVERSLWALVLGGVVAGLGQGLSFRAGLGAVSAASPPERRGEVASTFFVALYVAIAIPVVGIGVMTQLTSLATAGVAFACVVAAIATGALYSLVRHPEP